MKLAELTEKTKKIIASGAVVILAAAFFTVSQDLIALKSANAALMTFESISQPLTQKDITNQPGLGDRIVVDITVDVPTADFSGLLDATEAVKKFFLFADP